MAAERTGRDPELPEAQTFTQALQGSLNGTRKVEQRVVSLQSGLTRRQAMWEAYLRDMKDALRREQARFVKDMEKLRADLGQALHQQEEARAELVSVAALAGRAPARPPPDNRVDRIFEAWCAEDPDNDAQAVLRRAMAAAGEGRSAPPPHHTAPAARSMGPPPGLAATCFWGCRCCHVRSGCLDGTSCGAGYPGSECCGRSYELWGRALPGTWPVRRLCYAGSLSSFTWTDGLAPSHDVRLPTHQTWTLRKNRGRGNRSWGSGRCQCFGFCVGGHSGGYPLQPWHTSQHRLAPEYRPCKAPCAHVHTRRRRACCAPRPRRHRRYCWCLTGAPMQGQSSWSAACLWRPVTVCCLRMGLWRLDSTLFLLCPGFRSSSVTFCLCVVSRHSSSECLGNAVHIFTVFPSFCFEQPWATPPVFHFLDVLPMQPPWSLVGCRWYISLPTLHTPWVLACVIGAVSGPFSSAPDSLLPSSSHCSGSNAPNKRIGGSGSLACCPSAIAILNRLALTCGYTSNQLASAFCRVLVGPTTPICQDEQALLSRPGTSCLAPPEPSVRSMCPTTPLRGFHPCEPRMLPCCTPFFPYAPASYGIGEAPNKRIGGSGSLARLLPYPFWFSSVCVERLFHLCCDGIIVVAFSAHCLS